MNERLDLFGQIDTQRLGSSTWPSEELERVSSCPVCAGERRVLIHRGLTDRVFFCAPGRWDLYRCEGCGSCYLDPRPTREMIHLAYGRYFTHTAYAQTETLSGLRRLRRSLANGYRNWRYGTRLAPASKLGFFVAALLPWQRNAADAGMRHLPRVRSGGRLLDVGAGNGAYLAMARSAGWEVVGVEPDTAAVAVARRAGLEVHQGGIERLSEQRESFDVITMNHVIEHVHDPRAVLAQAFALLRRGGCLYVETPNINSYGHWRFGANWRGLEPPRHLVLFNWDSLEMVLRESGFNGIKRLPRPDVYPYLAAKSRAIADGRDPEVTLKPSFADRLIGVLRGAKMLSSHADSEFITLLAYKP